MLALSVRDAGDVGCDEIGPEDVDLLGALLTEPALAVSEEFPLDEVIDIAIRHRTHAIVVVDAARRVRGVIASFDLLEGAPHAKHATVADVMVAAFVLGEDTSVACAAAVMAYEGVDQIVVADARGRLRFVVTARDIARHVASRAGYVGLDRAD